MTNQNHDQPSVEEIKSWDIGQLGLTPSIVSRLRKSSGTKVRINRVGQLLNCSPAELRRRKLTDDDINHIQYVLAQRGLAFQQSLTQR